MIHNKKFKIGTKVGVLQARMAEMNSLEAQKAREGKAKEKIDDKAKNKRISYIKHPL